MQSIKTLAKNYTKQQNFQDNPKEQIKVFGYNSIKSTNLNSYGDLMVLAEMQKIIYCSCPGQTTKSL